jgi:hypothetical protein
MGRNIRVKKKCLLVCLATFILTSFPLAALAVDNERIQILERKLQERDKVNLELLERVEALERLLGVKPVPLEASKTPADAPDKTVAGSAEKVSEEETEDVPGKVVVKEGEAERALERSLTRSGALLLLPGVLEVEPSFRYARNEDSTPLLFTSGGSIFAGETELNSNSLTADIALRLGLPRDSQFEIGLPYQWREVETVSAVNFITTSASSQSGHALGDVRVGLAKTLLHEGLWRPDLIGRITWDTDSGKSSNNSVSLSGGYNELRGSLTAIKRQAPMVFVGGLSYEYIIEEDEIQPGPIVSANFGSYIAMSPETSLNFIFSGAYQDETELSGKEVDGSDRTLITFVVGGSTLLAKGVLLNLSFDIGLTDDADDFAISLSLPIRFDERIY